MQSKQNLTNKVGTKLKEIRQSQNLSQEELADRAGVYRTYIGHIEVGRYTPSIYTLYKICKALKVQSSDILPF